MFAKKSYLLLLLFLMFMPLSDMARADEPQQIKAVLFYPAFCAQCPAVIDEFLMPLSMTQVNRLKLHPVDITEPAGKGLFDQVLQKFGTSEDAWTVPSILIGNTLLRGEQEIKSELPAMLAATPVDAAILSWPEVAGLRQVIDGGAIGAPQETAPKEDGIAATLAWIALFGLVGVWIYSTWLLAAQNRCLCNLPPLISTFALLLTLLGISISIYLAYVALSHNEVMCGPIGDCMAVQASKYSKLLGVPMAIWGLVFYLATLSLYLAQRHLSIARRSLLTLGLIFISLIGVMFSIYLTGLELFVIHAVCVWCLTSAVLTALILLLVVRASAKA